MEKQKTKSLCGQCHKRATCITLCKKAQKYAQQDFVHQQDMITGRPGHKKKHLIVDTTLVEKLGAWDDDERLSEEYDDDGQ